MKYKIVEYEMKSVGKDIQKCVTVCPKKKTIGFSYPVYVNSGVCEECGDFISSTDDYVKCKEDLDKTDV